MSRTKFLRTFVSLGNLKNPVCRYLYVAVFLALTLTVVYWNENRRGARDLERALADFNRAGGSFVVTDLLPASTDVQDYFSISGILHQAQKSIDIERIAWQWSPEQGPYAFPAAAAYPYKTSLSKNGNPEINLFDAAWNSCFLTGNCYIASRPDRDEAIRFLELLKTHEGLFSSLEAATGRKFSPITPTSDDLAMNVDPFGDDYRRQVDAIRDIGILFVSRAQALLAACDDDAAYLSMLVLFRLADCLGDHPDIWGRIAWTEMQVHCQSVCWDALERRVLTGDQLLTLQTFCRALDPEKVWSTEILKETAVWIQAVRETARSQGKEAAILGTQRVSEPIGWRATARFIVYELVPAGWIDRKIAAGTRWSLESSIYPLQARNLRLLQDHWIEWDAARAVHPTRALADLAGAGRDSIGAHLELHVTSTFDAVVSNELLATACALERYGLDHKEYPDTLAHLEPAYLSEVPNDPIDCQPLRYSRTNDGRYRLYSVALDREDSQGDSASAMGDSHKQTLGRWRGADSEDWVWRYSLEATPVD